MRIFPTTFAECATPAPQTLISKAAQHRLSVAGARSTMKRTGPFKSAMAVDDIKGALAQGQPVVFAMPVADDWYAVKDDAVYTHLTPEHANFHAMTVIGYDEDRQAFQSDQQLGNRLGRSWLCLDRLCHIPHVGVRGLCAARRGTACRYRRNLAVGPDTAPDTGCRPREIALRVGAIDDRSATICRSPGLPVVRTRWMRCTPRCLAVDPQGRAGPWPITPGRNARPSLTVGTRRASPAMFRWLR